MQRQRKTGQAQQHGAHVRDVGLLGMKARGRVSFFVVWCGGGGVVEGALSPGAARRLGALERCKWSKLGSRGDATAENVGVVKTDGGSGHTVKPMGLRAGKGRNDERQGAHLAHTQRAL